MADLDALLDAGPIIVFDALCVLCSANAQLVLNHDRKGRFRLASMQGEVARRSTGAAASIRSIPIRWW